MGGGAFPYVVVAERVADPALLLTVTEHDCGDADSVADAQEDEPLAETF